MNNLNPKKFMEKEYIINENLYIYYYDKLKLNII